MDELVIKIELSVAEVNAVLRALGARPYEEVASVIAKVKQQGDVQVAAYAANNPQPPSPAKV
jgi:hypothetical protein